MTETQALVAGALMGAVMRMPEHGILVDMADVIVDMDGNYTGSFRVKGRVTGEVVMVRVEQDAPMP